MATQQQLLDQLDSLAKSIQDRCRSNAHLDNECQRYSMNQPYYPEPFRVYPHSSYPVHEPLPYESSDLRGMPQAYLSSNTFSPSYNPLDQLLKEQEDMLRRCTDKLSEMQTRVHVSDKEARNQVKTDYRLQKDNRHPHTTSTSLDTDYHSHESNCKLSSNPTPTQSSKSSLPPVLNISTSKTNEDFILEELLEPLQLETTGQGDEYESVDEEIEMESPDWEIYTEDPASEGWEECTPTLRSDLIPIQTDVVDNIPQLVVTNDIPHTFLNESPPI